MLRRLSIHRVYTFLIFAIIFLVPSNLFLKINPSSAYLNGLLVDYLIPKLYVSDVLIILLLSLHLIEAGRSITKLKNNPAPYCAVVGTLILLISIRQVFTPYPLASSWYLLKVIEFVLLGQFFSAHPKLLRKPAIYFAITLTIIAQFSLSLWQFITQKSLFKFWLLGETNIASSIGLTKDALWHTGRVLPYATTAHPNILGGTLAIFSLFLIANQRSKILTAIMIILTTAVIILTQSISALLTLIIGWWLIFQKKKINPQSLITIGLSILVTIPILINLSVKKINGFDSLTRRFNLQNAAFRMIVDHPLAGVGLNQFTAQVEQYGQTQELIRFVQPVHHLGLLWIAETGLLGTLLLWILIKKTEVNKLAMPIFILIPIATLDHYLLTQQTGLLLLTLTIFYFREGGNVT